MKPSILAGLLGAVFVAGLAVGGLLFSAPQPRAGGGNLAAGGNAQQPNFPNGQLDPNAPAPTGPNATSGAPNAPQAGANPNAPAGPRGPRSGAIVPADPNVPPPPPPLPAPAALEEGERARLERSLNEAGGGRVTHLDYEFESEAEREEWEGRRRETWERRLNREIEIKLRGLESSIGLDSGQQVQLREILEGEAAERANLVQALTEGRISRTSFDDAARDNTERARQLVQELLTQEQWAAYQQLKPREQVLQEETH